MSYNKKTAILVSSSSSTSSNRQAADENGCDVFARLLTQKQTHTSNQISNEQSSRAATLSSSTTATTSKNPLQPSQAANSRVLTQLENTLFTNKPLNLDPLLFPNGISNREVVEITGRVDSGKSELIRHLISRCVLPPKWRLPKNDAQAQEEKLADDEFIGRDLSSFIYYLFLDIFNNIYKEIDLRKYSCYDAVEPNQLPQVILIQTDAKLNILRVFSLVESRVRQALAENNIAWTTSTEQHAKQLVRTCLKSLIVYDCYNREQFLLALAALESYMQSVLASATCSPLQKSNITPIFIDSINSNFELLDKYRFISVIFI